MSARLLALYCLLNLGVHASPADSIGVPGPELVVYLKADPGQSSSTLNSMKRELSPLMRSAGYSVTWWDPHLATSRVTAESLVVVELHGACGIPAGKLVAEPLLDASASLAATSISDGHVLPFATVNCANLNRMLAPSLAGEAGAQRDFLYGRAMARVLSHELYHMLTGTRDHAHDGVTKPCFTLGDLLAERFEFERTALAKFHPPAVVSEASADAGADLPSGR